MMPNKEVKTPKHWGKIMTQYQKGMLVMDCLKDLGVDMLAILDAICDENLERSY